MFGFLDRATPETARRLFDRAKEVERKYLDLSMAELVERVTADIPENMRFVGGGEAIFGYDDFPDFSFAIIRMVNDPVLTISGKGEFSGFMLQRAASGGTWFTAVEKPAAFPIGPKARRLAASLHRQFGLSSLSELKRRVRL